MSKKIIKEIKSVNEEICICRGQLDRVAKRVAEYQQLTTRIAKGELNKLEKRIAQAQVKYAVEPTQVNKENFESLEDEISILRNPQLQQFMREFIEKRGELQAKIGELTNQAKSLKLTLIEPVPVSKDELIKSFAEFTYARSTGGNLTSDWIDLSLSEWVFDGESWGAVMQPLWDQISSDIEAQIKKG